jgi:hypothetical protein
VKKKEVKQHAARYRALRFILIATCAPYTIPFSWTNETNSQQV